MDSIPLAQMSPTSVYWILVIWIFALGGSIGSFLNVVVYRLPAGKSLTHPGSHCPKCNHPIRWHDNVPILGWIMLGGRCRDCATKISARYPAIETVTAAIFLAVGMLEGLSFGANLPVRADLAMSDSLGTVGESGLIVGYHLLMLSTLLAAAGIEYDGNRLPLSLFSLALVVGLLAPAVWPSLHPLPAWLGLVGPAGGLIDGAVGLAAGSVIGLAFWLLAGSKATRGLLLGPACVGLFLGWQTGLLAAIAAAVIHLAYTSISHIRPKPRPIPPIVWLTLTSLAAILFWRQYAGLLEGP